MSIGEVSTIPTSTTRHTGSALDRDRFCAQLERLLMGAAFELGQRGNLAQVVASIERGGVGGGTEDPNISMLRRLGATDTRGIDGRVGQIRQLQQRFGLLGDKLQRVALAHYLGTPRAHATIRSHFGQGQGGLAGVVLYRWQGKQDKARERAAVSGGAGLRQRLDELRAQLLPLEQEAATLTDTLAQHLPDPGPRPDKPEDPPLVLSRRSLQEYWSGYRDAFRAWRRPVRFALQSRRTAAGRLAVIGPQLPTLQAEQARLCADLANLASVSAIHDDEESLVQLCRSGKLDAAQHLAGAEADVRALHRAWYLTGKRAAKAWVESEESAA